MTAAPVVVEREGILVGRQIWSLREIRDVWAEERPPNVIVPLMVAAVAAVVALPLIVASTGTAMGNVTWLSGALVATSTLFFAAVIRLVTAPGRYCLLIQTSAGTTVLLETDDHQHVMSLLAQVSEAALHLRRPIEHAPSPAALTVR